MSQGDIRLIVNADDLGLHPRLDAGIFHAHAQGIVTSATLLVTGRTAAQVIPHARAQKLPLGLHLCLVGGLPPTLPQAQVPTLAPNGRLRKSWVEFTGAFLAGRVRLDEVMGELRAQLDMARRLGGNPDHLDSHQHLHLLPGLAAHIEAWAAREKLPLRWPMERWPMSWRRAPGAAVKALGLSLLARTQEPVGARRVASHGLFEAGRLDEAALLAFLDGLWPGIHELGCHPGFDPGVVPELPEWHYHWELELHALCSPKVRAHLEARHIRLCSFSELDEPPSAAPR